jgi:hypothetical protein
MKEAKEVRRLGFCLFCVGLASVDTLMFLRIISER